MTSSIDTSLPIQGRPTTASVRSNFAYAKSEIEALQKVTDGVINVGTYGAVGDGIADEVAAFQAAINATTDGAIALLLVPPGSYAGDLSGVTIGTRTVVWLEAGAVTYVTAAPPGNRVNTTFSGDSTRPWYYGHNGFVDDTTAGDATDRPVVRVARYSRHTGGIASINASAISAYVDVNGPSSSPTGRVDNYENAYVGQVDSYRSDTSTGSPNISVFQGTCFKHNASTGGFFGANFVARDQTTLGSTNSKGGLVALEIDGVASGPDSDEARIVCDVIARGYDASADGATSFHAGVRVRPANSGVLSAEPVNLLNGVIVEPGTIGSITTGLAVNGDCVTGVLIQGAATTAHIEISSDTSTVGVMRIGSRRKTGTNQTSRIDCIGWNSVNTKTAYAQILCTIGVATSGSESGALEIKTRRAGTPTTEMGCNDGVMVGSATGGYKGVGSVNVELGYYNNNIPWLTGAGSPEGAVTAPIGSLYSRTDGGTNTTLYVKESGTSSTGWVAK